MITTRVCVKCSSEFSGRRCLVCKKISDAKWRNKNSERRKAVDLIWVKNNPEKVNATKKRWLERHPEKRKIANANWHHKNPEKIKVYGHNYRAKKSSGKLSPQLDKRLYQAQKGLCACCKKPLGNDYHLDHIMPIALGGANEDWNIQLLTATCNRQKSSKHPIKFMQERGMLL